MSAVSPIRWSALGAVVGPVGAFSVLLALLLVPATDGGLASTLAAIAVAVALPATLVVTIPVRAVADRVEAEVCPALPSGRFHGVDADVTIGLGDPSSLLIRESPSIDVTGLPTTRRDIVIVTTGVFDALTRREVVALVGARLAALRDPWCRLATQGALAWWSLRFVAPFALIGFVAGATTVGVVGVALLVAVGLAPAWPERVRDRCVDLAAIERTTDPGGLAGAVRRVSGLGRRHDDAAIDPTASIRRPFLAMPRLAGGEMTVNVGLSKRRRHHLIRCLRLLAAADQQTGMVEPVGAEAATGRDLRRRWSQVARPVTID